MINLSMILMLIGLGGLVTGVSFRMIIMLYEDWKRGFKKDVLFYLAFLIPIIFMTIGVNIYAIYK